MTSTRFAPALVRTFVEGTGSKRVLIVPQSDTSPPTHNVEVAPTTPDTTFSPEHSSQEFAATALLPLNASQQAAVDAVLASPHGVYAIYGGPGTGKSHVIKTLTHMLRQRHKRVSLCAPTGAAAARLSPSACTAHSMFRFPTRTAYSQQIHPASDEYSCLLHTHVFIIDEVSMLKSVELFQALARIGEVRGCSIDVALLQVCVILVGDMHQLPPVCRHRTSQHVDGHVDMSVCTLCHLSQSDRWQSARKFPLQHSVRHEGDNVLSLFLDVISHRAPTGPEIDHIFYNPDTIDCQITLEDAMHTLQPSTRILCSRVAECHVYNQIAMSTFFGRRPPCHCVHDCVCGALHSVTIDTNALEVPSLHTWLSDADGHFHKLPVVALGCQVMLTRNLLQTVGLVNGASAFVTGIHLQQRRVTAITIKLHDTGVIKRITRTETHNPITSLRPHSGTYFKSTFPLMLAYSLTAHKAQGCTLSAGVIVHAPTFCAPGLMYVLLSRITSRQNLRTIGRLTPEMFIPIDL